MRRTGILIAVLMLLAALLLAAALLSPQLRTRTPSQDIARITPTPTADTRLSFSPEVTSLISSSTATIDVVIDTGVNKVTGVQLEIAYDPSVLTSITLEPGTFLSKPLVLLNKEDTKNGRISYALGVSPAEEPAEGSGTVAKITIKKKLTLPTGTQQTSLRLLPKSLVSEIGVEGSVLSQTKDATIVLGTNNSQVNTGSESSVPVSE